MDTAIWTLIVSSILAAIGWLFKTEREKRRVVENQLSDKKYSVYQSIIELFIEILNSVRLNKPLDAEYRDAKMINIMKDLIIYGSDSVLKKFSFYKQNATPTDPIRALKLYYDVMIEIRKDMGHPKTIANEDDLLGMFIIDYPSFRQQIMDMK